MTAIWPAYASLRDGSGGSLRLTGERRLVSLTFASWNRIAGWLRQVASLRGAA